MARPVDAEQDQLLIAILRGNARMPLAEIARELGTSRTAVQARIRRLERDGAIGGYTIVPGPDVKTQQAVTAVVLMELNVPRQAHVIAELRKRREVLSCHSLSGQFDLLVTIGCRTSGSFDELIDWIAAIDGVRRTTSSVVLATKIERHSFLSDFSAVSRQNAQKP